jgi:hypothetical protein
MDDPKLSVQPPRSLVGIPSVDLVVCPTCQTVVSLDEIEDLQNREVAEDTIAALFRESPGVVAGVFCPNPGCGQRLFDDKSWIQHLVARRAELGPEESVEEDALTETSEDAA